MLTSGKVVSVAIPVALLLVFLVAPVVPFTQGITIPGNDRIVHSTCPNYFFYETEGTFTVSTVTVPCLVLNGTLPAATLQGYGSLSYALFGLGAGPFADRTVVRQGNQTAVVYFEGGRAVAAEGLGLAPATSLIDPQGVLSIQYDSLSIAQFGLLNFTAAVKNIGNSDIKGATVYLDAPGSNTNDTVDGIAWISPYPVESCETSAGSVLPPGASCKVTALVNVEGEGLVNYQVEVRGLDGGTFFLYRQGYSQQLPTSGIGSTWADEFVQDVNSLRAFPLAENGSLDAFASLRFRAASSQPDLADYNFTHDANSWFGPSQGALVDEELLFPGGFTPDSYASFLKTLQPRTGLRSQVPNSHNSGTLSARPPTFPCPPTAL